MLSACNFPKTGAPAPALTKVSDKTSALVTDTPSEDYSYAECGFAWAREPSPDLSQDFKEALKDVQPQADGSVEAYGENCINNQGEVVRFLAMETDFHVTLKVSDLEDKQSLGELIEQVLAVVAKFPTEDTPGPQPGYVGITFEAPADELHLWFAQTDGETTIENGLRGEELFNTLQAK